MLFLESLHHISYVSAEIIRRNGNISQYIKLHCYTGGLSSIDCIFEVLPQHRVQGRSWTRALPNLFWVIVKETCISDLCNPVVLELQLMEQEFVEESENCDFYSKSGFFLSEWIIAAILEKYCKMRIVVNNCAIIATNCSKMVKTCTIFAFTGLFMGELKLRYRFMVEQFKCVQEKETELGVMGSFPSLQWALCYRIWEGRGCGMVEWKRVWDGWMGWSTMFVALWVQPATKVRETPVTFSPVLTVCCRVMRYVVEQFSNEVVMQLHRMLSIVPL